jgi:hypothetical protein
MIPRTVNAEEKMKAEKEIRLTLREKGTICEHIREIFRMTEKEIKESSTRSKILEECKIIFCFAKRMNAKLVEYNKGDYEL